MDSAGMSIEVGLKALKSLSEAAYQEFVTNTNVSLLSSETAKLAKQCGLIQPTGNVHQRVKIAIP